MYYPPTCVHHMPILSGFLYPQQLQCLLNYQNSAYPDAGYPDRLGPLNKFVENSTKPTYLDITGYRIKYSAVLRLLELQIRWMKGLDTDTFCK